MEQNNWLHYTEFSLTYKFTGIIYKKLNYNLTGVWKQWKRQHKKSIQKHQRFLVQPASWPTNRKQETNLIMQENHP
jgi:hypothetical protein